jgi:hypothetical protein
MHYHAVGHWAAVNTTNRSNAKLRHRRVATPTPPEASHPLVQYDANGAVSYASLLQAVTNSSFDARTGKLVAVGPTGVDVLVRIHNAQLGARNVPAGSYDHLTNSNSFQDRELLKDLKRRTSSSRVHLYDVTRTCISCNTYTSQPKKYAPSGKTHFVLCPVCFKERTTMGTQHLVPLAMMKSCFSSNPLLVRMIRYVACVTRDGVMGIARGSTHRGLLMRIQPIGGMGNAPANSPTKKRRFCASNDYWWSLFPDNTDRANAWKSFVWRLSKTGAAHNRHPVALVATAALLTSTGRASFSEDVVDRLWGKAGDLCMAMSAQSVAVDTKITNYLTFKLPKSATVHVASVACVGVVRALFAGQLEIHVRLVPLCAGADKQNDHEVDPRRSTGYPADVHDGAVAFCNAEAITHEHLWHCYHNLGARRIILKGSVAQAAKAAQHVEGESTAAWKHGGVFCEFATTPFYGLTVCRHLLAWDAYDSLDIQKRVRDEAQQAPRTPPFTHPVTLKDLCLVGSRAHRFV